MASPTFPRLWQALRDAAALVQARWQAAAQRLLTFPGAPPSSGQGSPVPPTISESATGLQATVTTTVPEAAELERGVGAYHLPSRINWATSPKARRNTRGRYYLVIPFRHYSAQRGIRAQAGTPAARRAMMPRHVYDVARRLGAGESLHMPGLAPYVPRLPQNVRPGYTPASPYARMQRTGTGRGVRYLTFRTITQDSPGWWIPARPPRSVAATEVRESTPNVRPMLEAAARADAQALIAQQFKGIFPW
jgi:hypothetical protein